ncbi:MAG: type II secretion system protein [Candidatus Vogelbacteria bacterium]|nr:type II secretion system protein [Candidatus Vogelbacteria bacterium]
MQNKRHTSKYEGIQCGFTLIELLVSVALFTVVATMAVGSMLATVSAYRRAQASQTAVDNLNFAMESMSRAIRQGRNYSGGGSGILFTEASGSTLEYRLSVNGSGRGEIQSKRASGPFLPLTSPEIDIDALSFSLVSPVNGQPRVRIMARGVVGSKESEKEDFALQTTITQRN